VEPQESSGGGDISGTNQPEKKRGIAVSEGEKLHWDGAQTTKGVGDQEKRPFLSN